MCWFSRVRFLGSRLVLWFCYQDCLSSCHLVKSILSEKVCGLQLVRACYVPLVNSLLSIKTNLLLWSPSASLLSYWSEPRSRLRFPRASRHSHRTTVRCFLKYYQKVRGTTSHEPRNLARFLCSCQQTCQFIDIRFDYTDLPVCLSRSLRLHGYRVRNVTCSCILINRANSIDSFCLFDCIRSDNWIRNLRSIDKLFLFLPI